MKRLLSVIFSLILILSLAACSNESIQKKKTDVVLKASFSSPTDAFAYCFILTDDGVFTTKYGQLQTGKLESENYIKSGEEKSVKLSPDQQSELLKYADLFYENKDTVYGEGTDGATNLSVFYKDTEIISCYDDRSKATKDFGKKLIEISPLEVDMTSVNGAKTDFVNSKWVSEAPAIELESIADHISHPKFKMTVMDESDNKSNYYVSFQGATGEYDNDGEYKCLVTFIVKPLENTGTSDTDFYVDGEYFGDEIILYEWGGDDVFGDEYEKITLKRIKDAEFTGSTSFYKEIKVIKDKNKKISAGNAESENMDIILGLASENLLQYTEPTTTLEDVYDVSLIRGLRQCDKPRKVYSVHKDQESERILIVFYDYSKDDPESSFVTFAVSFNKIFKVSDFDSIVKGKSTIEDVLKIDPACRDSNSVARQMAETEYDELTTHITKNGIVSISYMQKGDELVVEDIEYLDDPYISAIQEIDLQ